jgi:hypothetical protein
VRAAGKWFGAILGWGFLAMWAAGIVWLVVDWARATVELHDVLLVLALSTALIVATVVGSKRDDDYRAPYDNGDDSV